MKIYTMTKSLLLTTVLIATTGCGVVDSTSNNARDLERVSGGTEISPADMSLRAANKIEKNSFYNHFKYRADKNEQISLNSTLEFAITKLDRIDCQESGTTYVAVFDANMNQLEQYKTCNNIMNLNLSANTTYIFKMQYPGNRGYFNAETKNIN